MNLFLNVENPDKIIAACQQIFGIQNLSLAIKVENDLDTIKKAALFALREAETPDTFKVSTKRSNKEFSYDTYQVNNEVGAHLLRNTEGITVYVHQQDLDDRIDTRKNKTFFISTNTLHTIGLTRVAVV